MHQQLSASFGGAAAARSQAETASFVLLFRPLVQTGQAFAFACDPHGHVDMDGMSERARNNYLYARAMIGRELDYPSVHTHVEWDRDQVQRPRPRLESGADCLELPAARLPENLQGVGVL